MTKDENWSRDEITLALQLFLDQSVSHDGRDPKVQSLAEFLGRSPVAVARKLANLRAVQTGGQHGLANYGQLDEAVWRELGQNPGRVPSAAADARLRILSSQRAVGQRLLLVACHGEGEVDYPLTMQHPVNPADVSRELTSPQLEEF